MKTVMTAAVLAAGIFLTGTQASAAVACSTIQDIGEWAAAGAEGCDIGDKNYTLSDTDFADDFEILFAQTGLSYSFIGDENLSGPFTGFVYYSVEVLDPNFRINSVRLDATVSQSESAGATTVTKTITDGELNAIDTLISTDGSTDSVSGLSETVLLIRDDVSVAQDDLLSSFTNVITQEEVVPEPASMALLGLGLAGLAAARRRRS